MAILRIVFRLILALLVLFGIMVYWWYQGLHEQTTHNKASTYITIEPGSSVNGIISQLHNEGILESPTSLKLYLRTLGKDIQMQAGDYQFPSPISAMEVLALLQDGRKRTKPLTLPEGWTRFEIAARIASQFPGTPSLTEADILNLLDQTNLIADFDPAAHNLEGYLYPTTYEVEIEAQPTDVIERLVQEFKGAWEADWDERASELGRSRREIVTIASLIENESKLEGERPLVASVIYNRLKGGIPLGLDATNVYIAKMLGRWDGTLHRSDLEIDHPYNTRKIQGLPPGPICSPSKAALKAALYPAETDYLYYVLNVDNNDGSHNFYENAAGFARGKAKYQRWLATQRN
ncbi:MAG: endolytic transglycosylase MltG [Bacteroidota bacterium]